MVESVAKHYGFDPESSFESLPDTACHALLHRPGEEPLKYAFTM